MKNDEYMYALDWQHTGFRYDPKIEKCMKAPVFIKDKRFAGGGYNVCFPTFYPDGDYYFFIGKDFSWGYLTHPWEKRVYIFGESLISYFSNIAEAIGFINCEL